MTEEMQFTIARLVNSSDRACRVTAQQSPLCTPHAITLSGLAIAVNEALYIDIHVCQSHRNRSTFEISDRCACAMLSALRQPTGNAHAISAKVAPDRRRVISDAP